MDNNKEELLLQDLTNNDKETIGRICEILSNHEINIRHYIADFIAALCHEEVDTMLSNENALHVAQARWFYWYCIRYMTHESFMKLTQDTNLHHTFKRDTIAKSISRMSIMVSEEPLWRKRWGIMKTIIKAYYSKDDNNAAIRIVVPKNANVELKRE